MAAKRDMRAYLAGIVDGEGCIGLYRNKGARTLILQFQIQMVDRRAMDIARFLYGGNVVRCAGQSSVKRPTWRWGVTGDRCVNFLKDILPFSVLKQTHIRLALDYWVTRKDLLVEETETYYSAMRMLNARGVDASEDDVEKVRRIFG